MHSASSFEMCIALFYCTTKLFSSHKNHMKAFDLASQDLMCICCIPFGFLSVWTLKLCQP